MRQFDFSGGVDFITLGTAADGVVGCLLEHLEPGTAAFDYLHAQEPGGCTEEEPCQLCLDVTSARDLLHALRQAGLAQLPPMDDHGPGARLAIGTAAEI